MPAAVEDDALGHALRGMVPALLAPLAYIGALLYRLLYRLSR